MSDTPSSTLELLTRHAREAALLESVQELLGWDERTMMPARAGAHRADQLACLAGLVHRRRTDPQLGQWLAELAASPLAADPHSDAGATIRQLKRDYEKRTKLPQSLVEELASTTSLGQQVWTAARRKNDFAAFLPILDRIYELKRQQAAALGSEPHTRLSDQQPDGCSSARDSAQCGSTALRAPPSPYDPLLDDYEPGVTTADIAAVLDGLRRELAPLVAAIAESGRRPPVEILHRTYPTAAQAAFGKLAAAALGFDFQRGRLDVTHHPFCAGMGPHDCRITTRYDEHFFPAAFFGILHEAGHGLYEQGLRTEQYGLPPGAAVSLGIHESQSRLWENTVGRSAAFWRHFLPQARLLFPEALVGVSVDDFYFAINDVRPSLIRVAADEATYSLHIVIRFELELALLTGALQARDLPDAWNEKYRANLGIIPPSDADGVLQDIHWSAGLVGYFPTYALGNLYAAQFFARAQADLGDLEEQVGHGEFAPLREWLRRNIHQPGQCYTAAELVQRVTGRPLSHEPLMEYLRRKLEPLYGLA